jgi:hypothetical protein
MEAFFETPTASRSIEDEIRKTLIEAVNRDLVGSSYVFVVDPKSIDESCRAQKVASEDVARQSEMLVTLEMESPKNFFPIFPNQKNRYKNSGSPNIGSEDGLSIYFYAQQHKGKLLHHSDCVFIFRPWAPQGLEPSGRSNEVPKKR